jgi:hypothetical protein
MYPAQTARSRTVQRGAALLAFMLVMVVGASFVLVTNLNAAARQYVRRGQSTDVLQQAKEALIGYAVRYPEIAAEAGEEAGPGFLPCPDTDNDGRSNPGDATDPTDDPCESFVGRLPWSDLGLPDLRDHAGERLWYAVSDKYAFDPADDDKVLNSDTQGTLFVDGVSQVVAVILAPGPALPVQDRAGAPLLAQNYLEDANYQAADPHFVSHGTGDFNDQVVFITRTELMRPVEKRVLGEAEEILNSYREDAGRFPGLAPAKWAPTELDYDAEDESEGQLGFNDLDEVFETEFSVSWNIQDGTPFPLEATATMSDWNSFAPITVNLQSPYFGTEPSFSKGECTWTQRDAVKCNGRATDDDAQTKTVAIPIQVLGINTAVSLSGSMKRHYDFDILIPKEAAVTVSGGVRTRDLEVEAPEDPPVELPDGTVATLTVTEFGTLSGNVNISLPFIGTIAVSVLLAADESGGVSLGAAATIPFLGTIQVPIASGSVEDGMTTYTNTITDTAHGEIRVSGVRYDPGVGDEIPAWLVDNEWHKLIYVAYAGIENPPGGASPCEVGVNCIELAGVSSPTNNKRAIVLIAGAALTPATFVQDREASPDIADFFEDANGTVLDGQFDRKGLAETFNDQVRIVAEAPTP